MTFLEQANAALQAAEKQVEFQNWSGVIEMLDAAHDDLVSATQIGKTFDQHHADATKARATQIRACLPKHLQPVTL